MGEGAAGRPLGRIAGEEGHTDAAFKEIPLIVTQGSVLAADFRVAAVIGEEEDQRVLFQSGRLQAVEDASDRFVQRHDGGDRVGTGGVAGKLRGIAGRFARPSREDFRNIDHLAGGLACFQVLQMNHGVLRGAEDVRGVEGHRQGERPIGMAADEALRLTCEEIGAVFRELLDLTVAHQLRPEEVDERAGGG